MPDKPTWLLSLDDAIKQIETCPIPLIDSEVLASVLGVSRRRAQQLMKPLTGHQVGKSKVVERQALVKHLRALAEGGDTFYEQQRRQRFAGILRKLQREEREQPKVLVETTAAVFSQRIENLPEGVILAPGRITVQGFASAEEALQKLLALAMAVGNDPLAFEAVIAPG